MPKMPGAGRRPPVLPLVTPLAAAGLKPAFIDRWSDRVRVRTLKPQDVTQEIAGWLTSAEIMEGLNAPRIAMGLDAFRAYVASFDNLRRNLVLITDRENGLPAGLVFIESDLRHKIGSLHLVIADARSRDFAFTMEAVRLLLRNFFNERKMEKITFQPLARNTAAVAACRVSRLVHEGTLRSHRIDSRSGERLDQMIFGMTREEFDLRDRDSPIPYDGPGIDPSLRRRAGQPTG